MPVILLSMVTACISFTVTESVLFKPLREYIKSKNQWLGKLFSCGYCFGHWMAFGLTIGYQPRIFSSSLALLDYFLTALIIAWLAAFQWIVLCVLFDLAKK